MKIKHGDIVAITRPDTTIAYKIWLVSSYHQSGWMTTNTRTGYAHEDNPEGFANRMDPTMWEVVGNIFTVLPLEKMP